MKLDDDSIMQFGSYSGYKLEDIPASVLLWMYDQKWLKKTVNPFRIGLRNYIQENLDVLQKENNENRNKSHSD